jgi:23S rRNA (cytidine1920-2'-O)/16S rRNA (cytidine1409-2'-O)-methyltransferase
MVRRRLVPSRAAARHALEQGLVEVDGIAEPKPATLVDAAAVVRLAADPARFVSRGGLKLEGALDAFAIEVEGRRAVDVGASTGGFTDCLLQRGAQRVYAVDVGYGQLAWKLQQDPRVINLQRRNIRYLKWEEVGEKVDLVVVDTSFISLELVIPPILTFLKEGGGLLTLVKPQFEVGKGEVGKGGVVRDSKQHRQTVEKIKEFAIGEGLIPRGAMESPLRGPKGNREFFLYCERPYGKDRGTKAG